MRGTPMSSPVQAVVMSVIGQVTDTTTAIALMTQNYGYAVPSTKVSISLECRIAMLGNTWNLLGYANSVRKSTQRDISIADKRTCLTHYNIKNKIIDCESSKRWYTEKGIHREICPSLRSPHFLTNI